MSANLQELKERIERMSPADRLLLAAHLMAKGDADMAVTIAENVTAEYHLAQLFEKPR